jgi:hypothetical protein
LVWSFAFDLRDMSKEVCVSALLSLLFDRTKTLYRWSRLIVSFCILLSDIVPDLKKTLPCQLTHQNVDSAMYCSECNPCCI